MGQSFTRQELYDLVWSYPRTELAKQLDVSDVWIGKQCKAARVPVPSAGHWAKALAGKSTARPPLPIRLPGQPVLVGVGESPSGIRHWRHDNVAEPILPLIIEDNMDAQVEAALTMIGKVAVTRDLSQPHVKLSRLLKREARRRASFAAHSWSFDQPLFDDAVHQRQLRLFNSFCQTFDRISAKAAVQDEQRWVQGLGTTHEIQMRIDFGACSLGLRFLEPSASATALGEKPPSTTTLRVGHHQDALPAEQWCNGVDGRLEQQLPTIIRALLHRAENTLRCEAQRHYEWRLQRRQEHLQQLEAQKREAEVRRLAAIEARRKQVRVAIEGLARDARVAQEIRSMLDQLELHPDLQRGRPAAYVAWRAEALELINHLDPMRRPLVQLIAGFAEPPN